MILLNVDEAYAFDYLSILYIKRNKDNHNYNQWINCLNFLKNQFSEAEWNKIINSTEYNDLIYVNQDLFCAVERAKNNSISAKELDQKNMNRYSCKQKFQSSLFADKTLQETKI